VAALLLGGCGGGGSNNGDGGGGGGGFAFAGTWTGSEEYVQGTFANPMAVENLGFTSITVDGAGNVNGQTFDDVSGSTFTLTGMMAASNMTMGTATITGLPGPFNTPTSPNLTITGNAIAGGTSLTLALGNSFGECEMTLQSTQATKNLYAGMFTGTIKGSDGSTGTVSSFAVDAGGNVTGAISIGGMMLTVSGTITAADVATLTATPSAGSAIQLSGAAALTGQSGGMTIFVKESGVSTTVTINLVPST
jgi:hypothetical protein